jgi:hypothetical protein
MRKFIHTPFLRFLGVQTLFGEGSAFSSRHLPQLKSFSTFSLTPEAQRKSYQKETQIHGVLHPVPPPPFEKGGPKL